VERPSGRGTTMPMLADIEFYARREVQERRLADRTRNREGRQIHLELARCYAHLIEEAHGRDALR